MFDFGKEQTIMLSQFCTDSKNGYPIYRADNIVDTLPTLSNHDVSHALVVKSGCPYLVFSNNNTDSVGFS